jgi:streptomycin 6-kinase
MRPQTCGQIRGEPTTTEAPNAPVLLHADFSLRSMLDAGQRGFVAIDPDGALGERA